MARLICLTAFAAPFAMNAYNVDNIERVEVVPFTPAVPPRPPTGSGEEGKPGTPGVPAVLEHARVVFKGLMVGSLEVKETRDQIVLAANAS